MNKVVCIRTETKYGPEYSERLFRGCLRHAGGPFTFEIHTKAEFPGWWQKLMLFPPKERTVYLDLDVVITGPIDFLFEYGGSFCIWGDPWNGRYNSSVMSIAAGFGAEIRERFLADPNSIMASFHGDQEFIAHVIPRADTWQNFAPGKVKSYKADHLENGPGEASIVVFHGQPKPHELGGWVRDAWV